LSLLPGIQRAAQGILRFCMGVFLGLVFGKHCHQSGLDIGFGRIVPHGLAQGCLCLVC
jgi:hypothetical protein